MTAADDFESLSDDELAELEARTVRDQAADLEWSDRVRVQFPLALSVLWRADDAEWDQRRSVVAAMEAEEVAVILGGERSGKSKGLKDLTLAHALGGDHPAVRAWIEVNDLPRGRIPDGPGRVYAVALDSNASVRYHRPDFDSLVGGGKTWYGQNYKGEGRLLIEVPGHTKRGEIWFKSIDQGPDAMQGDSIRWWWIDEEPHGEDGRLVYGQLRARVMDQCGRGAISMVPMSGYTWVHDDFVRDRRHGARIVYLDALDNPHLPRDRAAAHYGSMTDAERQMRRFGLFTSREGLVYPEWAPGDGSRNGMGHTCTSFDIPPGWPKARGADLGLVNPTCVLWGALGDDHTLYVYREQYGAGPTYEEHGREVKRLSEGERYVGSWADPSAKTVIEETWPLLDVYFDRATNDLKLGIDSLRNRLRLRSDHRPRIKVFADQCPNLVRELSLYRVNPNAKDGEPLKKDDHAPDALRYLSVGFDSLYGPR